MGTLGHRADVEAGDFWSAAEEGAAHGSAGSLMAQLHGKVGPAAEAALLDRVYLYRLLERQGIRRP